MALFEQQGYDATSVEDIVAAANVSSSTVFRYFITKEDIVLTDEPKMVCVPRYLIRTPYNGVLASQTRHDYCPQSSMIRGDVTGSGGALVTANSPPRLANGSLSLVCIDILCHQASSDRTELVQRMLLTREVSVIRDRVAEQTTSYVDMFAALLAKRTCCDVGALQIRVVLRSRDSHR